VAITRAVKNLYVIETNKKHELLALLGLTGFKEEVSLQEERSSQEYWQQEQASLERKLFPEYASDNPKQLQPRLEKYGLDFRNAFNLTLFLRVRQGHYLLNPTMELLVGEEWVDFYDLLDLEEVRKMISYEKMYFADYMRRHNEAMFALIREYREYTGAEG
jgi:hypothetical protein